MAITLGELAVRYGLELAGDPGLAVAGVATLQAATPGTLAFFANPRYRRQLAATQATAVVLAREALADCPVAALIAANPYAAYARIAAALYPEPPVVPGIAPGASIDSTASVDPSASVGSGAVVGAEAVIGARVLVGPGCVVGRGARIGDDCRLQANVTIGHDVVIGRRCVFKPGAVVGSDGFGFARDLDGYVKVPQLGGVRLGDDVEVGANTTIDRGSIEDTIIEDGVKLDNLVQVGHNCRIGAHSVLAGCVGVSGSTVIGRRCMIGGAVGFAGHLEVGDDVVVTGYSLVSRSLRGPGVYSSGIPVSEATAWRRSVARLRRLGRRGGPGEEE